MDNNEELAPLVLGPLVPFMGEFTTPEWIDVMIDDQPYRYTFNAELECYMDEDGNVLYIEPVMSDGTITPDAYYEYPESC